MSNGKKKKEWGIWLYDSYEDSVDLYEDDEEGGCRDYEGGACEDADGEGECDDEEDEVCVEDEEE